VSTPTHDLTVRLPDRPRFAILTEGSLGVLESKTAVCVLRFRAEDVVALVDSTHAGGDAASLVNAAAPIPIVGTVREARERGANTLLIGIAPRGGGLPDTWRSILHAALAEGLHIVSGLHVFLAEDADLAARAREHNRMLVDLRRVPVDAVLPVEHPPPARGGVVLTVGSDCAVGKLTASLVLAEALTARGVRTVVGATGQTGVLLTGWGIAIDRVISDFAAGATETIVNEGLRRADMVVVEGQGSIIHPAYSGVSLALLHGARPHALVLCHQPTRTAIRGYEYVRIPPLPELIALYESLTRPIAPASVAGVALNTFDMTRHDADDARQRVEAETGLPTVDPVRDRPDRLAEAVERAVRAVATEHAEERS
jgi:uncharacterized NAD-dependent epimerase/dehydratase family protein